MAVSVVPAPNRLHQRELESIPDLLQAHSRAPDTLPFLLESAARAAETGRYSLLLASDPNTRPLVADGRTPFLERLDQCFRREQVTPVAGTPVFIGGWFVYLGYELAGEIEPRLPCTLDQPRALAQRCDGAIIVDHDAGRAFVVAESDQRAETIAAMAADAEPSADPVAPARIRLQADAGERYRRGVRRIREYIRAGDVFQVNLSRGWRGIIESGSSRPEVLYAALRRTNPAPFAGLARFGGGALLSSSPERLLSVAGDCIETRPIAGTRPRGHDPGSDRRLVAELRDNVKERAEHVMLIDLERNDLGRVCVPGSVQVDQLMVTESYAYVHHTVSNVRGRLQPGIGPRQTLAAVFPGGTITGCPKVRCMQIIAELEDAGRGFYTGSMGYLGRDGRMDMNILIRSLWLQNDRIAMRTGAGIVADSDPERELEETESKARGMLLAMGERLA